MEEQSPAARRIPPGAADRRRLALVFAAAVLCDAIVAAFYLGSSAGGVGHALRGVPLDDVWIHFVYARSIAHGQPFQYNPGQWETGSTSPLWAVLLAIPALLRIPPVAAGKGIGILLAGAAAAAGYRVIRGVAELEGVRAGSRRGELAGIAFAAALVALTPYFTFASVSGTEVGLFVLLMLGAIAASLEGRWRAAGILGGLAVLARPEGWALVALLAIAAWIGDRGPAAPPAGPAGTRAIRIRAARLLDLIVPVAVLNAPWIIYCLAVTGRPLPATFYLKAHAYGPFSIGQFRKIGAFILRQPWVGEGFGAAVLIGIGAAAALIVLALGYRRLGRAGAVALLLAGLSGPLLLYAISMGHPLGALKPPDRPGSTLNFYEARYLIPGVVLLLLPWAIGLGDLLRGGIRRAAPAAIVVLLAAATAAHQHAGMSGIYSWNCSNIDEQQVAAGRWIAANVPPGATVGVSDAGAIRYFGGRRVIDMVGLNDHRLIPLLTAIAEAPPEGPEEAAVRARFWSEEGPDYLAITRGWHMQLIRGVRADILHRFDLQRNTICGDAELVVARPTKPAGGP